MKKILYLFLGVVTLNAATTLEETQSSHRRTDPIKCPPAPSRGKLTQSYNHATGVWENRPANGYAIGKCPNAPKKGTKDQFNYTTQKWEQIPQ